MSATEREKTTKPGDEKNKIRASNTYYSVAVTAEGAKKFMPKGLDESQEKRYPNCTKDKQLVRNNKKQAV